MDSMTALEMEAHYEISVALVNMITKWLVLKLVIILALVLIILSGIPLDDRCL